MNKILTITAAFALMVGANACNKHLQHGVTDLTLPEKKVEPVEVTFQHPGAYVNAADIARAKAAVAAADVTDPVYAAWQSFCKSPWAQETIQPHVLETVVRGDATGTGTTENYITCCEQAGAAFQLALRWQISGDAKYAEAARSILNGWAAGCKRITANDNNQYLLVGFQGHAFANAAELLRGYEGWTASEQEKFKDWLRSIWLTKAQWFIDNHGGSGVCNLHYWSNWELCNLSAILAIGIYLDDEALVNYVNKEWLAGKGSGALRNFVPYNPIADPSGHSAAIAQHMESGRDQGHATLCVSMAAELCRMAQNVGLDFWGTDNDRVLAAFEYTAKYNVKPNGTFITTSMPFTRYEYCPAGCGCGSGHSAIHTVVAADGRGKVRPGWELIYAHYIKEAGRAANTCYYTKLFAEQLRYTDGVLTGDGGAGDSRYGTTNAAFDQLGWGTLLFYQGE